MGTYSHTYKDQSKQMQTMSHEDIQSYLEELSKILTEREAGEPYRFLCQIDKSIQKGTDNCGPWTLYFLEERLKNPDINFNVLNPMPSIQDYRLEIIEKLMIATREHEIHLSGDGSIFPTFAEVKASRDKPRGGLTLCKDEPLEPNP